MMADSSPSDEQSDSDDDDGNEGEYRSDAGCSWDMVWIAELGLKHEMASTHLPMQLS